MQSEKYEYKNENWNRICLLWWPISFSTYDFYNYVVQWGKDIERARIPNLYVDFLLATMTVLFSGGIEM